MTELGAFMARVSGLMEPWHLGPFVDVLGRIGRGEAVRACVAMPPQVE